nr:hypothetical protein [Tanacetum cinerariifolium]
METYSTISDETKKMIDVEAKEVHIILAGIDNDIYLTVSACANAKEMWIAIKSLTLGRNVNPLARVTDRQQQSTYYPKPKPNYNAPMSTTQSQAATQSKGKEITRAPSPPPNLNHKVVSDEDDTLREKEIAKLMALISKSFKRIYKPTNNNLKTSSTTKNKNVALDEGTRLVFDKEPLEHVHANDEYNELAMKNKHTEQHESINDTYVVEQYDSNTKPDSLNISNNRGEVDQDEQKVQEERALFASLIKTLKVEIDKNKKINK